MAYYLVTGGCGFIGSHLVDSLILHGHRVRVLDDMSSGHRQNVPSDVEVIIGDVSDTAVVKRAMEGVDGCYHLAAIASVERGNLDWVGTHKVNLSGTIAILDAAKGVSSASAVPVVYASSAAVYGETPPQAVSESYRARPLSAYGADKLGCELHAYIGGAVHSIPTCGFRFFNVYGPRQDPKSPYSGVISIFCDRLRSSRSVTIYGTGEQARDFVYVGDVVRALLAGMRAASINAPVFNVCTGKATTINELATTVAEVLGMADEPEYGVARAGEIPVSIGDPAKASSMLKFVAETDLRTGLSWTISAPGSHDIR